MTNLQILIDDIAKPFDAKRFLLPRFPLLVKKIPTDYFDKVGLPNLLDFCIKRPGDLGIVPPHLESKAALNLNWLYFQCLQQEKFVNPNWNDYYVYLTINQGHLKAGETQRNGGAHFDGMQGARYPNKFPVCHQYILSTSNPTLFYYNSFKFTKLDENKDNFFKACDLQKKVNKRCRANEGDLYLQTAYQVHESPVAAEDCFRTFIRIEFTLKKFDRIENSINPNLPLDVTPVSRPIPEHLI